MRENSINWRKGVASFFAFIMTFQAMSGILDVVAIEMGKINPDRSYGDYYDNEFCPSTLTLNKDNTIVEKERVKKDAVVYQIENEYDESLEVIEKRTENSKTYKLPDGSYVQETYFEPVHTKEGNQFVDIDNALENVSRKKSEPLYENKLGVYDFKMYNQTMVMKNKNKDELKITFEDAILDLYDINDNVVLFSEVYENIDLEHRLDGASISSQFYINGTITKENISYTIDKGELKVQEEIDALLFVDGEDNVVFSYIKPVLRDSAGEVEGVSFDYKEKGNTVEIVLSLNQEWINSNERIYPLTLSTRTGDESVELNVDTAYNRSASPNTTSNYYDLYVGYEDGTISGGVLLGKARTYVHLSNLNLGKNKVIVGAQLKLWKRVGLGNQWNTIEIGKSDGYMKPLDASWNNKPAVTKISTTTVRNDQGWQDFDIKSYVEDIYKGKNNIIELKATNESSSYKSNVFSSESGNALPKVSVQYRDDFDVDPNLPHDVFDTEMRIFSILNKGFEALSFDGIAKPDADVLFELVKKDENTVIKTEKSKGKVSRYFIDPIYVLNHIANTQTYDKDDINYTTDYIYKNQIPEFDVPYEYLVKVKSDTNISTREFRTDAFIKYKVKTGDNLKNIASYYGVTIEQIKEDNHLKTNIIKEDDILILRFKKDNPKVSKDMYTPPVRTIDYEAKYVNRGPRCSSGSCPVIDPVNVTTGNYYYEGIDFTLTDLEDFAFNRYYNSTGPQLSNMFGNGFTTPIESYISYDKDGNILYFTGDGKIFEFKKDGTVYQSRTQDHYSIEIKNAKVVITDDETGTIYYFDDYGYLDKSVTKDGVETKINYDDYGLITSIQIGTKTVSFDYNSAKMVKEIILPSGKKLSYKYDDQRNMIEFIDANGSIKKYTYDQNNYLTSITDKNGYVVTQNTYDDEGRVLKQIDGNGHVSTLNYQNDETIITNADGQKDVYKFNEDYDVTSISQGGQVTSKNTYDEYRNITSMTDEDGLITKYTYDEYNLLKVEYPDGTYEEYKYDSNDNLIYEREKDGTETHNTYSGNNLILTKNSNNISTAYVYDDKRRVIKETDQHGVSKSYTYIGNMVSSITHSNGLKESFEYDANGNVTKESDNQGKVNSYIYDSNNEMLRNNYYDGSNEQWTYDKNGNVVSYKDRIGGITYTQYDKNNNLISSTQGAISTSKKYNEVNQVISETDEQGLTTSYTYDVYGNKKTETNPYGNTTTYEYDASEHLIKTIDALGHIETKEYDGNNLVKEVSKEGLVTTYQYDELNREIKKVNPNGTIETKSYEGLVLKSEINDKGTKIEHIYDSYNREIKTISTFTDGEVSITENKYNQYGNVVETIVDGQITKNMYDVYNQVIKVTDSLGQTTETVYDLDGNVIKEIDALGYSISTKYDANQNVTSVTDKNGNVETKKYNANSQLISETDALGYVHTHSYNDKGQLIETIDPYSYKTTYSYDEYGNQIETKLEDRVLESKEYDAYGREIHSQSLDEEISTQYDSLDRVIATKDEILGLAIYYKYDIYGNVVEEKDSQGKITLKSYDTFNRNIRTTDAYGRVETLIYDVRDNVINQKTFDGTQTISTYDVLGNMIETRDSLGKITKNIYNELNQVIKTEDGDLITEYVYDKNGQVIETKDLNNNTSTKSIYDGNGNVIEEIDALGYSIKTKYDALNQEIEKIDAKGYKTSKEYDANGNVTKEIDAKNQMKQYQFNKYGLVEVEVDERGFDTRYEYNDDFLVSKVIDPRGYEVFMEYNDQRLIKKETDPNKGITEYEYNVYGQEINIKHPGGKVTTYEYDVLGNVVKETNDKDEVINEYDELARLVKTTRNNVVQEENVYNTFNQIIESYDANHNKTVFRYDNRNNVIYTDEKGSISEKEYDVYNNLIKEIDNGYYITNNSYDAKSRLIKTVENDKTALLKEYDANDNEVKVIEYGVETRNTYDSLNQLVKVEMPSTSSKDTFIAIQTIKYDEVGNPLSITDANGYTEEKLYDANNNVVEEIDKKGVKNLYEYDGLNNLIKAQNHEGRYVNYIYDKENNVISKKVNGRYADYTYNKNNQLISQMDEYGYKTEYVYDEFDRVIEEIQPNKTKLKYTYDNLGNILSENNRKYTYDARSNLLTATDEQGTIKNTYDLFDNKTSVIDSRNNKVEYKYNKDNQLTQKLYAGIEVSYRYNAYGLLETVKKGQKTIASYQYNNRNEMIQLSQGNIVTQKTYDDMGNVLTQKVQKDKKILFDALYEYDANDNLVKEVIDGKTNTYIYNEYDELVESQKHINNNLIQTTYEYDPFGNQNVSSSNGEYKTYEYNDKNQIEKIKTDQGTIKYSYNDNGDVSKKINENGRVDYYSYNDLNQLTQLVQGQYTYDYTYDAEDERIQQVITDTKDYHYDVWYQYVEYIDVVGDDELGNTFDHVREQVQRKEKANNTCQSTLSDKYDVTYFKEPIVTDYVLDRNVEYTEVLQSNDKVHIYGDTLLEVDEEVMITGWNESVIAKAEQNRVERINYTDFGYTEDINSGQGYNGEMLDATGLIYLRARYYDPSIARFVQIDRNYDGEAESVASQNKYAYTLNNPYKYVDSDGNKSIIGAIKDKAKKAKEKVKKAKEKAKKAAKAIKDAAKKLAQKAKEKAKKIAKKIKDTAKKAAEKAKSAVKKVVTKAKDAAKKSTDKSKKNTGNSSSGNGKKGILGVINKVIKKVNTAIAKCPKKEGKRVGGKTLYSFTDKGEYKYLVSNAKTNALSSIKSIKGDKAVKRASASAQYFDNALASFKTKIGYDKDEHIIKMDYLISAFLDVNIKIVKDFTAPRKLGFARIRLGPVGMKSPKINTYDMYYNPTFIEKNLVFMDLVNTKKPWDIKWRNGWGVKELGSYFFEGSERENDYLGNYMYGVTGQEMFRSIGGLPMGNNYIGSGSYILDAAGLAQQWDNWHSKVKGSLSWIAIKVISKGESTGDNDDDAEMIKDGIERWCRDYK